MSAFYLALLRCSGTVCLCKKITRRWRYLLRKNNYTIQFSQSCPALCNPMDCSMPGFPVHHQLPELAHTHVHQVGDATQPSHPLSSPPPPAFNLSQHQGLIRSLIFHQGLKTLNPLGAFDSLKQATVLADGQCWLHAVKVSLQPSLLSSPC